MSLWILLVLSAVIGYCLGSIPSALWLARTRGINVFSLGSGNMGAMNIARNMGWSWGVMVLIMDAGKATLAMYLGMLLVDSSPHTLNDIGILVPLVAGLCAIVGHLFSIWAGFRGGKALASGFGVYLPLLPWAAWISLLGLVIFIVITRRQIRGIFLMCLAYPIVIGLFAYHAGMLWWLCTLQTTCITGLIVLRHWNERHSDPKLF